MIKRPQFTVRDLLIWTTVMAAGIVLLKVVFDSGVLQPFPSAAENILLLPASTIFPFGIIGFFVAPLGMLIMLVAMSWKSRRTFSAGLFLLVATICWGVFIANGDSDVNSCALMLSLMAACSAACFGEACYRTRNDHLDITLSPNRFLVSSITSVIIVVATNLLWGTAIILTQI